MVTREDVENIALLSKLFADTINNAPTDGEEFDDINNLSNVFREDEVVESYDTKEILSNAPEQAEDHFLVRNRE